MENQRVQTNENFRTTSWLQIYFVAAKPPAGVTAKIEGPPVVIRGVKDNEYYQQGKLCIPPDGKSENIKLDLELTEASSQFSLPPSTAPPTKRASSCLHAQTKCRVCLGEFEANCAGPHDIFMQCGTPPINQLA